MNLTESIRAHGRPARSRKRFFATRAHCAWLIVAALLIPLRVFADLDDDIAPPGSPPLSSRFVGALDERCVISVLNRVGRVQPDGNWRIDNVPTNFGPIRARATCVVDGETITGQSAPFIVQNNGVVQAGWISFLDQAPVPTALRVTNPLGSLGSPGATAQLTVTAVFPDGSTSNATADSSTTYASSNPAIATVSRSGLVTAVRSGTVVVTVLHEAVSAFTRIMVMFSNVDSDGDGIPDDIELKNGLDANNPVDALEDPDQDGLTNFQELMVNGTKPLVADSDGDGIKDGDEVSGKLGFITNPLLADTDGDGVRDALEIQTGSDPTNANSLNLAQALQSIALQPPSIALVVNTIIGEASQQLFTSGNLRDGTTIDLTRRGTNYTSSNLLLCNFGVDPGRVFAGSDGACTITASNSGFSAQTAVAVRTFAPTALAALDVPGFANNVDVSGSFAYIAAGAAGLQVVNVADPSRPSIVGSVATPGNADDVKVAGTFAYIADGAAGLHVADVSAPSTPRLVGVVGTPGTAQGVVVRGNLAYVADGSSGLQVIDVSRADRPVLIGTIDTPGTAKGVDVEGTRAVVADGSAGIQVVDVADPTRPMIIGSRATNGQAQDVVLRGSTVYVADFARSFTVIDITDPTNPVLGPSTPSPTGGLLNDVAVVGRFALGADVLFVNGVPIIDVSDPTNPIPRSILDFRSFRDDNGIGIAADGSFVYLTAAAGAISDNGTTGATRLYIGQYLALVDNAGIAPSVQIAAPRSGDTFLDGESVAVRVNAADDVAVVSVNVLVNGAVASTGTAPPYLTNVTMPAGVSSLTIGARAVDPGGNVGVASDVVVNVVPDPRTTVVGQVLDLPGNAAPNIPVTCLGISGISASDGRFSLPGVPTTRGDVICSAGFMRAGLTARATSLSVPPVRGGTTDVGVLREPPVIAAAGDADVWHFAASRGQMITLTMTRLSSHPDGSSDLDPQIELRDSQGLLIASNDEGGSNTPPGPGRNAIIQNVTLPATDTYTVIARGAGGTSGPYTLQITPPSIALVRAPRVADQPGPPRLAFQGEVKVGGEADTFTFPSQVGDVLTLRVIRLANRPDGSGTLDPIVELHDSRGFLVARDDDAGTNMPPGPGRNALIRGFTVPATDTYSLIVRGSNGSSGPYTVEVFLE